MQEDEPYIITKRRTVRRVHWGRVAVAVFALSLLVMGGVFLFSRTPRSLHAKARSYRLVAVGDYADLGEASARAETAIRAGGAGYLYGNGAYAVALSCYAKNEDATAVCERLRQSGEDARILTLSCDALTLDKPKSDADTVKKMLTAPAALFDELYDISVRVDTKELSEAAAKYAALKMHVACMEHAGTCRNLQTETGDYLAALFLSLADTFSKPADASGDVAAALKYALCDVAVQYTTQTNAFCEKIRKSK